MSWITDAFTSTVGTVIKEASNLIDGLTTTAEEKLKVKNELERIMNDKLKIMQEGITAEIGAKERILVAELQQDDKFTKRARPMVVYSGIAFIALNYVLIPMVSFFAGMGIPKLELPAEFWWGWSGIVATWTIGRSFEKSGIQNKATSVITGSKILNG